MDGRPSSAYKKHLGLTVYIYPYLFFQDRIKEMEKEFDLVLFSEMFDESMVLLADKLCWPLDYGSDFVFHIFSQSSQIFSYERNGHKNDWSRKAEQFEKLQFWNDKIDQNTNFAKLPSAKWLFLYTGYLRLFLALVIFVSVFLMSENLKHIILASETLCATSISNSQFPLDENQKSTRCGGNCSIL